MHENERPSTPESVWKSIQEKEEVSMEMTMTPDQLCAKARWRDRENVWVYRTGSVILVLFAGFFAYNAYFVTQPWVRLGQLWMVGLLCFYFVKLIRQTPRRMRTNESCASFLEREFEGSRNTALEARRAVLLLVPAILMSWLGGGPALRLKTMGVDPSSWWFQVATGPGQFIVTGLILIFLWFSFGNAAKKASRQIEELRRAVKG